MNGKGGKRIKKATGASINWDVVSQLNLSNFHVEFLWNLL